MVVSSEFLLSIEKLFVAIPVAAAFLLSFEITLLEPLFLLTYLSLLFLEKIILVFN